MIVDVHTHIPTHENEVPDFEIKLDTSMKSGIATKLTNSVRDYLESFKNVEKTFVFGIAPRPWKPKDLVLGNPGGWPKDFNHNDIAYKLSTYNPEKIIPVFWYLYPFLYTCFSATRACFTNSILSLVLIGKSIFLEFA